MLIYIYQLLLLVNNSNIVVALGLVIVDLSRQYIVVFLGQFEPRA